MPKVPPAVRILPMSDKLPVFCDWNVTQVQQEFFLGRLLEQGGLFHFFSTAMSAEPGTIVLFQYRGVVVALAELVEIERYPPARYRGKPQYAGAYRFDPLSIRVFEPVDAEQIRAHWPNFTRFGRSKQALSPAAAYPAFAKSLRNVRRPRASGR
jgi:hypothetical protein